MTALPGLPAVAERWGEPGRRSMAQAADALERGEGRVAIASLQQAPRAMCPPLPAQARLALGGARWAQGEKRALREAYARIAALWPPEALPPEVAERCPRCARARPPS